jgi:ribonucleoside-diphosphate reductase alpha chain
MGIRKGSSKAKDSAIPLTDNARTVLTKRYLRKGPGGEPVETIAEMFQRVAHHVALAEQEWSGEVGAAEQDFYRLLTELRFFPNSPTFTGAGTPLGQLAACFVLPISDDMGRDESGIFQTLRDAALIQQTGGGNGFSFSRLRPKGALVASSAGQATGPVGFLRVYDKAFGEIAQGGSRRGANMAVLRVDHPDIFEFVQSKTRENAITNFNVSVGITDDFMRAVEADADFDLVSPQDHKVWRAVKARQIFDEIVKYAHHNGEPGMLFLDAANRQNPVPHLYDLEATNPCFVGSTRISMHDGLIPISELAERDDLLWVATDDRAPWGGRGAANTEKYGVALRAALPAKLTRTQAQVLKLETSHGYTLTATPDHKLLTGDRGYVKMADLEPGDKLLLQSAEGSWSAEAHLPNVEYIQEVLATMGRGEGQSDPLVSRQQFIERYANLPQLWSHELGLVLGTLVGDGWVSPSSKFPLGMTFSREAVEVREWIYQVMQEWFGAGNLQDRGSLQQLIYGRLPAEFFVSLGVQPARAREKRVPQSIWSAPRDAVVGFLQGLFTADGVVEWSNEKRGCTVRLGSSSRGLLADAQLLLLNFGIVSRIVRRRKALVRVLPDGKGGTKNYRTADQYELVIGRMNRNRFAAHIGFADSQKQDQLTAFISGQPRRPNRETFRTTVMSVADAGEADVYDFTEPVTHSLVANGIVAHNCGEQWLGPYENCCLGSVNLAGHVTEADGQTIIDWEEMAKSVATATRFLDDVVTANAYVPAVPQLKVAAHRARRIGLGIMGLGDLMYQLGVRYGSETAQEFAGQVMEFVRYHAMSTSIELAEEREPFPAIKGSIYDPENLQWTPPQPLVPYSHDWGRPELDWGAIVAGIKAHGIRNAAQTTVAPTGTIATVTGCEAYGCEPVFALAYVRHVNDNGRDLELTYTSPLFEHALIEAGLDSETRQRIVEQVSLVGSCQGIEEVPQHIRHVFVVAQDISAEEHVRMQAALQAFVDNSISKTCNFPAIATEEDVADAYFLAWRLGCKGLTVYVTGSREKVVLETHETRMSKDSPSREHEKTDTGQPTLFYEPKKPRSNMLPGKTYRIGTPLGTTYVTVNENGGGDPFEVFLHASKAGSETAAVSEAIGRLISYVLRLSSLVSPRERLAEVVRQLGGIGGGRPLGFGAQRVLSLPDAVAQVLSDYLGHAHAADNGREHGSIESWETAHSFDEPNQLTFRIGDLCPECGEAAVVREEGCRKCYACGYSEC